MFYFAYGSNMNPARVAERGLTVVAVQGGRVEGMALRFNKQSRDHTGNGHANIVLAPGVTVEGVLYELADRSEIRLMDRFENVPVNYRRERVMVQSPRGPQPSWTYFANPGVIAENLRPTRAYLEHLLAGARFLSDEYLAMLSSIDCAEEVR